MDKYPEKKINIETIPLSNIFSDRSSYETILHLETYIDEIKPDIVELFPIHLYLYQYQDRLVDLNEFMISDDIDRDDFYPGLLNATSYNGNLVSIPIYYDLNLMYYSKKSFEESGIPYPQNGWLWEEVFAFGDTLSLGVDYNSLVMEQLVMSYGGNLLSTDFRAEGTLDSTKTKEAIQRIVEHFNETNDDYAYSNQFSYESDIGMTSLMWVNWYTPDVDAPIGITGVPYDPDGEKVTPIIVSGLGINNESENILEAWNFIRESLVEDNEVSQLNAQRNLMSTRKSVSASSGFDQTPIGKVVISELNYAQPSRARLNYIHASLLDRQQTEFKRLKEGESMEEVIRSILLPWEEELKGLRENVGR